MEYCEYFNGEFLFRLQLDLGLQNFRDLAIRWAKVRFLLGINPTWSDKRMVRRGKIIPDIQHIQLSITPRVKQPCEEKFRRSVCSLNLNELLVIGLATKVERADRCVLEISTLLPHFKSISREGIATFTTDNLFSSSSSSSVAIRVWTRFISRWWKGFSSIVSANNLEGVSFECFREGGCNEFEKLLVIGWVYMILVIHLPRGTGFLSE